MGKKSKTTKLKKVSKPAPKKVSKPSKSASSAKKAKSAPKKAAKVVPAPKSKVTPKKTSGGSKSKGEAITTKDDSSVRKPPFPIRRPASRTSVADTQVKAVAQPKFTKKFLEMQHKKLLELRDHILDQMQGVAQDSLRSKDNTGASSAFGMHQADAGSDAYEKDFALSLLSQEQDALYEIEEGIKRIENNTYGICEMSGRSIPTERLEAIPFARYTVDCQSKFEQENKGKHRWDTSPQFMDSAESFFEEDDESEEEDKAKAKE